jgi:hypothetical protein
MERDPTQHRPEVVTDTRDEAQPSQIKDDGIGNLNRSEWSNVFE